MGCGLGSVLRFPAQRQQHNHRHTLRLGVELRALADVYVSLPALLVKISCSLCKQTLYICIRRLAASSLSDLHWQHASWARFGAASLP